MKGCALVHEAANESLAQQGEGPGGATKWTRGGGHRGRGWIYILRLYRKATSLLQCAQKICGADFKNGFSQGMKLKWFKMDKATKMVAKSKPSVKDECKALLERVARLQLRAYVHGVAPSGTSVFLSLKDSARSRSALVDFSISKRIRSGRAGQGRDAERQG